MEQLVGGFEKACRQARLFIPDVNLSPMDVDKDVKGGELVNESQPSDGGNKDGEVEEEVTSAKNDDMDAS